MILESLPEGSRETLLANIDHSVKNGSVVQSASNSKHAQKVKSLFQNMDIMDEDSVKNAFKQYETLMTPVYKALGLQNSYFDTRVTDTIEHDLKEFISQISSGKSTISTAGTKINCVA